MSTVIVTGCAGFIGSHLCDRLLASGHEVIGLDAMTGNYPRWVKERNLRAAAGHPKFHFMEVDLCAGDLEELARRAAVVFHLAALPGVRSSWGTSFADYLGGNVLATQRLLEAVKSLDAARRPTVVYASSSSVYGDMEGPLAEDAPTYPRSPYGVSKLAAEQLCRVYASEFGIQAVSLRYFTVFGPRQRPDMAVHRFIRAALCGQPVTVYGDGEQTRDFTYVGDVVDANLAAAELGRAGDVFNIGGGNRASVNDLLAIIESVCSVAVQRQVCPAQPGDVRRTYADMEKAAARLAFRPQVGLTEGIERQVADMRRLYGRQS
ncbi:MAG: NAD-dependent epimerase/dehydratase family protein [Alicyclobacillus shizuokensis]|nr:NAD-dependent epimerase/dehydratase family protein [Alicyclobacillus shizuokensis]